LISLPTPIPTVAPPLPKSNPPFNFLQKNPDYFSTYSCKEEIYVSSASVIELDCNTSTQNDGSDSGIYNASTTTGCSSCSENSLKREKAWGNAFCKSSYQLEGFYEDYEEQDVSIWIDLVVEDEEIYDGDFVYESIYEVIPQDTSQVKVVSGKGDKDSNLTKIAEVAGKRIKKLRRNWSLKKEDITKGLSKIKKSSKTLIEDVYNSREVKFSSVGRRKISLSQLLSTDNPELRNPNTTFYVGLKTPVIPAPDVTATGSPTNQAPNAILNPGAVITASPSVLTSDKKSDTPSAPVRSRRKSGKSGKSSQPVVRPLDPPPAPPINHKTHPLSSSYPSSDSSTTPKVADPSIESSQSTTSDKSEAVKSDLLVQPDIEETYTSTLFLTEPLYQFYDRAAKCDNKPSDSDLMLSSSSNEQDSRERKISRMLLKTSRSSVQELLVSNAGQRSLWSDLPEVLESGILENISNAERKLQEAIFEIISSEASYLKSLNVLINHFANSPKFVGDFAVLCPKDKSILFNDVYEVRACSEKLLHDLETRWQETILLSGISDIILHHARNNFSIFIKYCSNQIGQDKTLKRLKSENVYFADTLKELESSQACQSLSMYSFLMLPMQRITRLPLLTAAIISHLPSDSPELTPCKEALDVLNSLVKECNEATRHKERMEEMKNISQTIDFRGLKSIPLISSSRWLIKRIKCTKISWKENPEKLTFGKRVNKQNLVLFLFTDLLLICKKKSDDKFAVIDYSHRNMVEVSELESSHGIPGLGEHSGFPAWLTLLQNHEHKTQEMLISFSSESDRFRWIEVVSPVISNVPGEKIYESWDCPKIEVISSHEPSEHDEIAISKGETANVLKKTNDGWLFVEKCSDGCQGWLPKNTTLEVESDHKRAKNFKQRYQFLKSLSEVNQTEA
jgi:neuronal guanine nucleotide exchange factor